MEAHRTPTRWTYAEFARLPSEGGARHEIIAGQLAVTPAPRLSHQRVVTQLAVALHPLLSLYGELFVGPVDVLFAEGDYLEPDLVFVRKDRATALLSERGIEGAPDLVVEVLSPSTESRDRGIKLERYRHYGVGQYWIVDPGACEIEAWDLAAGAECPAVLGLADTLRWRAGPEASPLEVPVAELFGRGAL